MTRRTGMGHAHGYAPSSAGISVAGGNPAGPHLQGERKASFATHGDHVLFKVLVVFGRDDDVGVFQVEELRTGLESASIGLLNNAKSKGVNFSIVNLMTMDYGGPDSHMGQDSINAANDFFKQLQKIYPSKTSSQLWSMVGLTNLIGQNDTPKEIFTLNDAQKVLTFAQQQHIGELSIWEVSRDNGSCPGNTSDQDTCSGLSQSKYAFTNIFKAFSSN